MIKTVAEASLAVNETLKIRKSTIRNGTSSKRICIVTGIHGDELEGQYLVWLLGNYLKNHIGQLDGTVDIYPALNPLGIDSITRGIPQFDLDMNRIFPGNRNGTMMESISASIIEDIQGADICIDIHSSNIYLRELPQIRMSVPTMESLMPYGKLLNVDFIWVHESATVLESTLAHSLNSIGTKTLVVEMGVGMRITQSYGKQLFDGILNLMHELGMWSGETKLVREPIISLDGAVEFLNSDAAGIFVPSVSFGTQVKKGEHIGDVLDALDGSVTASIESNCDGLLFTLREYPIVYGGSLLGRILKETEQVEGTGEPR
ncbi:M14 family metallopeptidase [uncultured Ruminococcus sp.]|uniref:M14 family metallopeptidase n=1 Tax=uncultured Ruminococcus sp. TaxID=165186 RepID=UPI002604BEB2|nr:M14 family metallopeptidase [uncultured Ruminococcus sp.]